MSKSNIAKKIAETISRADNVKPKLVDEVRAKQIAKAYDNMAHNPDDPAVKKAYDALIAETTQQFKDLQAKGYKFTKIQPGQPNPYKNSDDMFADMEKNKHLYYFPTEQGFGSDGKALSHPLLAKSGEKLNGEELVANDIFRIVHDFNGHGPSKAKFGSNGEEKAWREHMKVYSPEAQKALTAETRGQNSFVNFGPNGEWNRANPAQTKYADQKAGLLPDWAMDTKQESGIPVVRYGKEGLTEVDPKFAGTATDAHKFIRSGQPTAKTSSFYDFNDKQPEATVLARSGDKKYSGRIDGKLYDFAKDENKFLDKAQAEFASGNYNGPAVNPTDLAKLMAKEAGFDGLSWNMSGKKIYESFKAIKVRPSYAIAGLTAAGATLGGSNQAEASPSSVIASKMIKSSKSKLDDILPATASDADRAALRSNPEKYKQYLATLDTEYGPRNERAKKMGFGDETYYHGTTHDKPITKFDSSKSSTGQLYGRGNYVTKDVDEAAVYAQKLDDRGHVSKSESGSVYPLKIREGKSFNILRDPLNKDVVKKWGEKLSDPYEKDTLKKYGRDNYSAHQIVQGSIGPEDYSKSVVDAGYNSIAVDPNVRNVINKKDLRSTNAAFDPRFSDSADLLAFTGNKAPKIAARMMKPEMSLGTAFNAVAEPFEKLNEVTGRNSATKSIGNTIADVAARVPGYFEKLVNPYGAKNPELDPAKKLQVVQPYADMAAELLTPDATGGLVGSVAKLNKIRKASNAPSIAQKLVNESKQVQAVESAKSQIDKAVQLKQAEVAERIKLAPERAKAMYLNAAESLRASKAAGNSVTVVPSSNEFKGFGTVTVKPEPKKSLGTVTVKP